MSLPRYSLDTNMFLTAWNETYRPSNFQTFWDKLAKLIESGRAVSCEEVERELKRKDDGVSSWVQGHAGLFVPLDETRLLLAKQLASDFPTLAKERLGRMRADGFVIALAQDQGLVVVTAENRRGPEKIPNICESKGVECISIADMIEREGWTF